MGSSLPKIELSIIYLTYRPGGFDILADSLANQTYQDYELIVVDNYASELGRPDRSSEVKRYLKKRGIKLSYLGPSKPKCFPQLPSGVMNAMNTGLLLSTKEVVIILTDYIWLPPDWLEKIAGHADLLRQNHCIVLGGQMWENQKPRNNEGTISVWEREWQGSPEENGCRKSFFWMPEAWEFSCTALPWALVEAINGFPEYLDAHMAHALDPIVERMQSTGGKAYVDKENITHIIDHRGWQPAELWHQAKRRRAEASVVPRENCFDLKRHDRGKAYWLKKTKKAKEQKDIFNKPEYWCGNLGYRAPGYSDFPINGVKVDYIMERHPKGKILDVGCAMGYLVGRLRAKGVDAWGIDISQYAINHAPDGIKPYLKVASTGAIPFKDNEFDIIFSASTLEHLPPDIVLKAISEIKRVGLRGIIAVTSSTDPHFDEDVTHKTKQPLSWWRAQFPPEFEVRSDSDEAWLKTRQLKQSQMHRIEWVRSRVSLADSILEVGCAENPVWAGTSFKVTTIDKVPHPDYKPDYIGEAEHLPFKDKEFDVVCEGELLEHVPDPQRVLREAARVAKKKVILTVPWEHVWTEDLKPFWNPGHVRFYTPETLEEELRELGLPFNIEAIRIGGWAWLGAEIHRGTEKATARKAALRSTMEWADYVSLTNASNFIFTKDLLNMELVLAKQIYDSLHPTRRFEYPWVYFILQPLTKNDTMLEVGAGKTALQFYLSRLVREIHSLDINPDFVNWMTKTREEKSFANLYPVLGDMTSLTFPSDYFDKVICISTLEHLPKDKVAGSIEELIRVTKPRGKIALTMDIVLEKTDKQTDLDDFAAIAAKYSLAIPGLTQYTMILSVPPYNLPFAVACVLLEKEAIK